jgi:hypothetical protein
MKTFNFTYYGWEPSYRDFDQCDIDITANTEAEAREQLEEMVRKNQLFPKYNFHLVGINGQSLKELKTA